LEISRRYGAGLVNEAPFIDGAELIDNGDGLSPGTGDGEHNRRCNLRRTAERNDNRSGADRVDFVGGENDARPFLFDFKCVWPAVVWSLNLSPPSQMIDR